MRTRSILSLMATVLALAGTHCGDSEPNRTGEAGARDAAGDDRAAAAGSDSVARNLELNGCDAASYEDHSAGSDPRTIAIARVGLTYTPKCMTIAAGQTVLWEGNLAAHPLAPGNPEDASAGSPDSPIQPTSSAQSVEFTFEQPGEYPYFCTLHAFGTGQGMAGVIRVR